MPKILKGILFSVLAGFAISCSEPAPQSVEMVKIGPDASAAIVVYFMQGTSEEQIARFDAEVISTLRPDGRGEMFRNGIGGYLRLLPFQAQGHDAIAITFHNNATEEQRRSVKESMKSNEIVYKLFENIAPKDIKASDVK